MAVPFWVVQLADRQGPVRPGIWGAHGVRTRDLSCVAVPVPPGGGPSNVACRLGLPDQGLARNRTAVSQNAECSAAELERRSRDWFLAGPGGGEEEEQEEDPEPQRISM
ncbi:hypothetical protein A5N17_10190 [Arthrobacter sp. D2]|nr:hypothetical protein [Arthrobacter sp. M5]NKR14892.1 hypothetical protein [Arthrobacter sp. M6]OEH62444.1 hypothetical protein A5N13_01950 [Arthrobacter sp. D4]OEH63015.1 hypothetical protein A5N17_10190 [Arthrobacter sp. D2]